MESQIEVSKSSKVQGRDFLVLGLLLVALVVIAGELRGEYTCNYCDTGNPGDPQTQVFITSVVDQDIEQWSQGDFVKISNSSTTGEWTFTGASIFNLTDAYPNESGETDPPADDPE